MDDGEALIGEQVRIAGRAFTVIGVLAPKGASAGGDGDQQVHIPFQTGRTEIFGTDRLNDIWTLVSSEDSITVAMAESTQTFTLLLAGVAAVSLLVGGIGIMNIMLVSVTERTREIGVRKALGATSKDILFQFLAEAVILCVLGGALGVAAGMLGAMQLSSSMGWKTAVDAQSIVMAFTFASAIGLIFGVWPARRASALDPIEALRHK